MQYLRLYIIFLTLVSINLRADDTFDPNKYRHFIKSMDAYKDKKDPILKYTIFKMVNGTEWYIAQDHYASGSKPFPEGTEVFITNHYAWFSDGDYSIEYDSQEKGSESSSSIRCNLREKSSTLLPTIREIKKICTEEAGWFTAATYIDVVVLSDGSNWLVTDRNYHEDISPFGYSNFWSDLRYFNVGDCVIVSPVKNTSYEKWVIIDTERSKDYTIFPNFHYNSRVKHSTCFYRPEVKCKPYFKGISN